MTDLLRKALIVATKLKLTDLREWLEHELNGYPPDKDLPRYRMLKGSVRERNPFHGWLPVQFQDLNLASQCETAWMRESLAEIEEFSKFPGGTLFRCYPEAVLMFLRRCSTDPDMNIALVLSTSSMTGVLNRVRNTILEWALKLESEGILGEDMSFNDDEKQKAANSPGIHIGSIGTFTGTLGSVTAENFQIGDYSSINQKLKEAGISQAERNELENLMDELKGAKPEEKPGIAQRGMNWVGKNAANLGAMAAAVRAFFQHG